MWGLPKGRKQLAANIDAASAEVDTNAGEENEEIKPIGKGIFGNIYDQFKGKAKSAINFLMKIKSGEAVGALHHNEVGDISLVWGNDKAGLKKILRKHPEVVGNLQEILNDMHIAVSSENRIVLESNTHKAVVSKMLGEEKTPQWLLTAYEKKNASGGSSDIGPEPQRGKQNGTAPLQDKSSTDKDTESSPSPQENRLKNSTKSAVESASAELIQVTDTHDNTLFIELSKDGSYWNVNSGGIFRKGYSNKKETVAKTEPQQPTNAVSSDSSLSANVKDGITNAEPNGEPTVSLDKGTTLPADQQTSDEENTKKVADSEGKNTLKAKIEAASAEVDTNAGEESEEIKPIGKGVFGNIYDQFKGKVKAAFDFLIKHKSGDLLGVFHREGFGDIDLVWGDDKKGLQHIINDHILVKDPDFQNIEEAVSRINDIIMSGVIVKEGEAKIVFEKDGYRVVISKNIHGEKRIGFSHRTIVQTERGK